MEVAERKSGTFRPGDTLLPTRSFPKDSRYATLNALVQQARGRTLGSKDLADQVKLPEGSSEEEWLAVTTVEIFNELNLLYSAFRDCCTDATCPEMSAGRAYVWLWADGDEYKTPVKVSAPKYCELCLTWVDKHLADVTLMPVEQSVPFPRNYRQVLRVIFRRMFRVYAHIFHSHYKEVMEGEAEAHLNHSFKHFLYFVKEFGLVEDKDLEPMKDLVQLYTLQKEKDEPKLGEISESVVEPEAKQAA
mmetsp:Transcript_31464/g.86539  ORF Transcript_31464/g.86539 Transcript_31464/m.86539 type:complete len:247 (+) Transcript_31464:153-893(+)